MDVKNFIETMLKSISKYVADENISKDQRASYILGSSMFQDNYEDIILIEPLVEELAEMASDFEILKPTSKYYDSDFHEILSLIEKIKKKYNYKD